MRKAVFLTLLFLLSLATPLANAATTETQFKDGSTSYTHTFSSAGEGSAGYITLPYGAEVTGARFNLVGEASQTTYTNFTTDSHFGGAGSGSWSGSPPSPYTSGSRSNVRVENTDVTCVQSLRPPRETDFQQRHQQRGHGHTQHHGRLCGLGRPGLHRRVVEVHLLSAPSTTAWTYAGVNVVVDDEIHQFRYTSSSLYNTPTVQRFNATTGSYIGTASFSTGTCSSTSVRYNIYDATMDSSGSVWLAHYSSYLMSSGRHGNSPGGMSWTCQNSYNLVTRITSLGGFDESTNKLGPPITTPVFPELQPGT
ncbi:MAG: hypothetical protein CM15mP128_1380 [Methanobacteriota archaeon]|nr:MAG: hypothetical protein CM15mP128_1380 [Euryarchaeota archaeon]